MSNLKDLDGDGSLDFCARFEQSLACFNLATGEDLWRENGEQYIEPRFFADVFLSIVEDETAYVLAPVCDVPSDISTCGDVDIQLEIRNGHGTLIEQISLPCDESTDEFCQLSRRRFQDGAVQLLPGLPLKFVDSDKSLLTEPQTPDHTDLPTTIDRR